MATRFFNPRPQFQTDTLKSLPGAKLFFFEAGTSTPKDTFKESGATTANANPVIVDSAGRIPEIFLDGQYKVVLKDKDDAQIWEVDNFGGADTLNAPLSDWQSTFTYDDGDLVTGSDGCLYESLVNNNLNNDPTTSPIQWKKVEFIEYWNTNETYSINDVVRIADGTRFRSTVNSNSGNDPATDRINWQEVTLTPVIRASAKIHAFNNF